MQKNITYHAPNHSPDKRNGNHCFYHQKELVNLGKAIQEGPPEESATHIESEKIKASQDMKANDTRRKTDLQPIKQALERHYRDHGRYPDLLADSSTSDW